MNADRLAAEPEGVILAGLSAILLGVTLLASGRSLRGRRAFAAWGLVGFLAAGAALAALMGHSAERWAPALALAGVCAAGLILRSGGARLVCAVAASRLTQSLALTALGFAAILGHHVWANSRLVRPDQGRSRFPALTDLGGVVHLYFPFLREGEGEMLRAEEKLYPTTSSKLRLIRTAPPTTESNCHGWVFTEGACSLYGSDVERILFENNYVEVFTPRGDDLIVYRDQDGEITHTGIVRTTLPDGRVLVESKWGMGGRFIHEPDATAYSEQWQYFRSSRGTHLLRDVPGAKAADRRPAPAVSAARGPLS